MINQIRALTLSIALALWITPAIAQDTAGGDIEALRQEIEVLKEGQKEILKQLNQMQRALQASGRRAQGRRDARPPFEQADISIKGAPSLGSEEAELVLIEFSDYQCPYCRRFSADTLPQILEEYVETGKVRYVFRDFPLQRIHPEATEAAVAARCAGRQGKYWEMHDRLFADPYAVKAKDWQSNAEALNLNIKKFTNCMARDHHQAEINQSLASGKIIGVTGTPAFFLGSLREDGETVNATESLRGAQPFAAFKATIEKMMAGEG